MQELIKKGFNFNFNGQELLQRPLKSGRKKMIDFHVFNLLLGVGLSWRWQSIDALMPKWQWSCSKLHCGKVDCQNDSGLLYTVVWMILCKSSLTCSVLLGTCLFHQIKTYFDELLQFVPQLHPYTLISFFQNLKTKYQFGPWYFKYFSILYCCPR